MRILIINTNESSGGAAKAANRLYKGLRSLGIEAFMLVQKKESNDKFVIGAKNNILYRAINFLRGELDKMPKLFYPNRKKVPWSVNWLPNLLLFYYIKKINPDIVNLHWINNGFISIGQIGRLKKLNIPIVWTLHDSWVFTGGCHIPYECDKYIKNCGKCSLLESKKGNDLSRRIWLQKNKIYNRINFTVVVPSNWLKKCATKSNLLKNKKIFKISNSINLDEFKVVEKNKARKKLDLNSNKKRILFGAMSATTDKNKGFDLLIRALKRIKNTNNLELLIFGNKEELNINIGFKIRYFGKIEDNAKLNYLYSASDVTVIPSRSESFSLVTAESFSSGTPAVAFEIGGIPDIIDHKKNGYLAKPFDVDDLKRGIEWCIEDEKRNEKLSINAREKVAKKYSLEIQANEYKKLFEALL
jgi:glycosyltransferase involved in cell wall biosynthesis